MTGWTLFFILVGVTYLTAQLLSLIHISEPTRP